MICIKCQKQLPEGALYCPSCGKKQVSTERSKNKRSNGSGSVYKRKDGSWMCAKVVGYKQTDQGKAQAIRITKGGFRTKKEALEYLPNLKAKPSLKEINLRATFRDVYELWLPTHERKGKSKSTIACYKAAYKYFWPLWDVPFCDIGIDDLRECLDDCPNGKRTKQNMRTLGTLLYAYAIPRGYVPEKVDLAHYLFVGGDDSEQREAFMPEEIEIIRRSIGLIPYADYIYCQIYLGFRPHEFLSLDIGKYNAAERCFVGGGKTEAGTDRSVTVSPKIQPIIDRLVAGRSSGPVFGESDGRTISDKKYRDKYFAEALRLMGLPLQPVDGKTRKLTPHCCRHTFATLMKAVEAPDKDKLELMGHTDVKMLQHYQHVSYADLRRITDRI